MTRLLACVLAALVVAGCSLAATPQKSEAVVHVGIGDQNASMFSNPLFEQARFNKARYFPSWNVALPGHEEEAGWLDQWLDEAQRTGTQPLISFFAALGSRCPKKPCKLPSVRQYKSAFKAFQDRWGDQVKVISPWNEANHRSQPTFKNPKRAAQYYNVVRKACRKCTVVAADVIDEKNMERWLKAFRKTAKKPRIWGLHNYRDTNKRKGQLLGGTKRLVKAVKGQIWLTETGGIVRFVLPNGHTLFKQSERRANTATKRMFALAKRYRKRIKRLYIYHWQQPDPSNPGNRFDAGLIRFNGDARPAYRTVLRQLRTTRTFNP